MSRAAMLLLEAYDWPRNIRELQSVLGRALIDMKGDILLPEDLPERIRSPATSADPLLGQPPPKDPFAPAAQEAWQRQIEGYIDALFDAGKPNVMGTLHATYEPVAMRRALRRAHGNQREAIRLLDMPRSTFTRKLREYGINPIEFARTTREG